MYVRTSRKTGHGRGSLKRTSMYKPRSGTRFRKKGFRAFRRGFDRKVGYYGRFASGKELKFHDVDTNDAVVATGGFVDAALITIAEGTTETSRIGRKITIKSINWRFNMELPAATSSSGSYDSIRVLLVLDKQCNGAAANILQVWETADYQSFNNLANKDRFRTLMDRTYDVYGSGLGGDGTTIDTGIGGESDSFFKKCNIPINYDSNTGAITEIRSNNLVLILISSNGLIGFDGKMRIRYGDN